MKRINIIETGGQRKGCNCELPGAIHLGRGVWIVPHDMDAKCKVRHWWRRKP